MITNLKKQNLLTKYMIPRRKVVGKCDLTLNQTDYKFYPVRSKLLTVSDMYISHAYGTLKNNIDWTKVKSLTVQRMFRKMASIFSFLEGINVCAR